MTAGPAAGLSDLVSICHTAFGRRPAAETLELVAAATLRLADAWRVWIVLVSPDEVAMVEVGRGGEMTWRWDLERAEAEQIVAFLGDGSDEDPVAFPFGVAGGEAGALVVAVDELGEELSWQLEVIAAQIHLAIRTERLAETHQDQMVALSRMVVGLRQKSQEHVGELQALRDALDRESIERAEAIVATYHDAPGLGLGLIESPIVAGLLLGEISVARQRSIELSLSPRSRLERIPASIGDLGFASVISNLLSNAFDAVEGLPRSRRRVSLLIRQARGRTVLEVRDWGSGLGDHAEGDVLRSGYSSKAPDRGTGLSLVNRLALAAGGGVEIERLQVGTRVKVTVADE